MPVLANSDQKVPTGDPVATASRPRRHGSPREGVSLANVTEVHGKPVREAIAVLVKGLSRERLSEASSLALSNQRGRDSGALNSDSLPMRITWNLVSIWLTALSSGQCAPQCGFRKAESWFRANSQTAPDWLSAQIPNENLGQAEQLLNSIQFDSEFRALLPYIMEEHGPGSRASVMKDPSTASARAAKREAGAFYTPSDVADYMVEHTRELYSGDFVTAKCLDPACGTGVFLLALLRAAVRDHGNAINFSRLDYITSCLHGLDVSGHALDAAAFVLLQECLSDVLARKLSPLKAWKLVRRNLVEADALRVDCNRRDARQSSTGLFGNPLPCIAQVFPKILDGFDILVGNPPYAAMGERQDFDSLASRFASLNGAKVSQRVNLYPLFLEMMWKFTRPGCNAAALVTPLSVAFHSGLQYKNCRRAMSWNGGRWQFAFFDREPHALFGEEVKTRNAILFRLEDVNTPRRGEAANIETGPLRKWTSRTRAILFQTIDFVAVDSIEIIAGIPKLGGTSQAEAFMALTRRLDRFSSLTFRIGTCAPMEALTTGISPKVFVGGTAYNFLNVYRHTRLLSDEQDIALSENPVHSLEFKSEADARAGFAILSSQLIFWLWHVLGDGFHVPSWLFKAIPFARDSFTKNEFDSLSRLGDALWQKLQDHRFTSINRGRQTVAFRPLACNEERDAIDTILAKSAGLKGEFVTELRSFVQRNAVVDSTDKRRNHVKKHFTESIK